MWVATVAAGVGCGTSPAPTVSSPAGPQVTIAAPIGDRPELPEFLVRMSALQPSALDLGGGRFGVLVSHNRVVVDGNGAVLSFVEDEPFAVHGVAKSPGRAGGYLVVGDGVGWAERFDGDLRTLMTGTLRATSVGSGFVLATTNDGRAVAVDIETGARRTGLPLGLFQVATDDRVTAGVAHGGWSYVSRDGGKRWEDVTRQLPWRPSGVSLREGSVVFERVEGAHVLAVLADGLGPAPPPAVARPPDPQWPDARSPLEAALAEGVPIGDELAILTRKDSAYVVSLRTGQLVEAALGVFPPGLDCSAMETGEAILFLCGGGGQTPAAVFVRDRAGGPLRLEKTFSGRGGFVRGTGDSLLYTASCTASEEKDGIACLRSGPGRWKQLDVSEALKEAWGAGRHQATWVPTATSAWVVVLGRQGGVWNATTGSRSQVDEAAMRVLIDVFRGSSARVTRDFTALDDGTIVGRGHDGSGVRVKSGGKVVERSPYRFSVVRGSGPHALALKDGRLWQSNDWGFTYSEVKRPPDAVGGRLDPDACSPVGCVLRSWLRVGWNDASPSSQPRAKPRRSTTPDLLPEPPLTALACVRTGAPAVRAVSPRDGQRAGFGATVLREFEGQYVGSYPRGVVAPAFGDVEATSFLGQVTGRAAAYADSGQIVISHPKRVLRWIAPFDQTAQIRRASVTVGQLVLAAQSVGGDPMDPSDTEQSQIALPVQGKACSAVFPVTDDAVVWARTKGSALALSTGSTGEYRIASAVQTGTDELGVLLFNARYGVSVRRLGVARAQPVFALPASLSGSVPVTPDALAVGPGGRLAVIRIPTLGPPTAQYPALLLRPDAPPVALAPWSTLAVEGSPECQGEEGYRAVVLTPSQWMHLGSRFEYEGERLGAFSVRWNDQRVCLEAVELPASYGSNDGDYYSYVVARFGDKPSAGRVFVGEGLEIREPLACKFKPASEPGSGAHP